MKKNNKPTLTNKKINFNNNKETKILINEKKENLKKDIEKDNNDEEEDEDEDEEDDENNEDDKIKDIEEINSEDDEEEEEEDNESDDDVNMSDEDLNDFNGSDLDEYIDDDYDDDEILKKKLSDDEEDEDNEENEKYNKNENDLYEPEFIDYSLIDEEEKIEIDAKITRPFLTKYEKVKLLAYRTNQLARGAKTMIKTKKLMSSKEIAIIELNEKVIPLLLLRPIPNGKSELWNIRELEF
jgi:DNA-directed RNA polymerase subunit K/omega